MPNVPGLREHGWEMKGVADAVALRDRAIAMVEAASLARTPEERRAALHFVVVGANFTGVEVAGEFQVFLRDVARQHGGIDPDECSMTLVELTGRVLSALRPELSDYALRNMTRRGIRVRLVSMPCLDRFAEQDQTYRDSVLPPSVRARVSVEAASPLGWHRWVGEDGDVIAMEGFGASAPAKALYQHFGFSGQAIADRARAVLERTRG